MMNENYRGLLLFVPWLVVGLAWVFNAQISGLIREQGQQLVQFFIGVLVFYCLYRGGKHASEHRKD